MRQRSNRVGRARSSPSRACASPNMFDAALDGSFKGLYVQGEDIAQSDPNTHHVTAALSAMECVVVQDLFLNETAKYAHVFLPGSSFLEKDGTFTNAERRISRVRKVMEPRAGFQDWEVTMLLSNALGYPMQYRASVRDHGRDRQPHADVRGRQLREARSARQHSVAVQRRGARGHADHACRDLRPRQGQVFRDGVCADDERTRVAYPLLLTTGRILSQYNVGAQTRRTDNVVWAERGRSRDSSARRRGSRHRGWRLGGHHESRRQHGAARERHRSRPAGRGLHHVPLPGVGRQRRHDRNSDWATNCPEYKVTAVEAIRVVHPEEWRARHEMARPHSAHA